MPPTSTTSASFSPVRNAAPRIELVGPEAKDSTGKRAASSALKRSSCASSRLTASASAGGLGQPASRKSTTGLAPASRKDPKSRALADPVIGAVLSDADVDGSHIQVLLLTLFFRHFPKLIEAGHVFVARPPLFRVDAPARGKKPATKVYALDEGELTAILDKLRKDGVVEGKWSISRFKGLGEMSAEQLWDTTLNPDTRRLMPVQLGLLDFATTEGLITQLMGKGEAAARRELMELHGDSIEIDV